jgi:hypothetical protein
MKISGRLRRQLAERHLELSAQERGRLEAIATSRSLPHRLVRRARKCSTGAVGAREGGYAGGDEPADAF